MTGPGGAARPSRRRVLILGGRAACAAAVVPSLLGGCDGPAVDEGSEIPDDDGWITLVLADYPALADVGGMASIDVQGRDLTLAVVRARETGADAFAAVGGLCTHLGCPLSRFDGETDELVCDCHGSRFALSGAVTAGPASEPLPAYPTEYDAEAETVRCDLS